MYLYCVARHGRRRWRERRWTFAWRRRKSKIELGRLQLLFALNLVSKILYFLTLKTNLIFDPPKWGHGHGI